MANLKLHIACVVGICINLQLAACGGGGDTGDTSPSTPPTATASGLDRFLLFPNPQQQPDKSFQTKDTVYAQAYYAAIDPTNAKDTVAKWKAANGFDTSTGIQVTAVFGDKRDLGYGRRMIARRNTDGTMAFLVENYQADPGGTYGYSPVSLEAAVRQDTRWRILINAIEVSPGPAGGVSFAKFFNFDSASGQRALRVDLDGRGDKAMPGPCITCHGGRGDALTPDATSKLVFALVQGSASNARGDVQAHLAPFEVASFDFSTIPGFTRSEQEAALKTMNSFVLCSYPMPASAPKGFAEDACRRDATGSEWQGTAADLIKQSYGGDGLPRVSFSDPPVPADWQNNTELYRSVVAPSCRACHVLRGTNSQSDIDLTTFAKFQGFAKFAPEQDPQFAVIDDRIKVHVIDRGDMPLAKIVYDTFWNPTNPGPGTLAAFLKDRGFTVNDANGAVLRPGRPIADPGPDRVIAQEAVLSAAGSLPPDSSVPANSYSWSIVSRPVGSAPILTNPDSVQPTFNTTTDGTYVLQLVARNGAIQSEPARLTLVVNSALSPAPAVTNFANIKDALKADGCASCHSPGGSPVPPVFFAGEGGSDRTDEAAFYAEVRSRINFTDIVASPLLRKPSGHHHNGGQLTGFDSTALPGSPARAGYDLFLNWILNGAKQ